MGFVGGSPHADAARTCARHGVRIGSPAHARPRTRPRPHTHALVMRFDRACPTRRSTSDPPTISSRRGSIHTRSRCAGSSSRTLRSSARSGDRSACQYPGRTASAVARTRGVAPCQAPAVWDDEHARPRAKRGRCKLHGGLSTGPRTEAGKARSRAALECVNAERRRTPSDTPVAA